MHQRDLHGARSDAKHHSLDARKGALLTMTVESEDDA